MGSKYDEHEANIISRSQLNVFGTSFVLPIHDRKPYNLVGITINIRKHGKCKAEPRICNKMCISKIDYGFTKGPCKLQQDISSTITDAQTLMIG